MWERVYPAMPCHCEEPCPGRQPVVRKDAALEEFVRYDELDEQPRFPTGKRLWDKLQYPILSDLYQYPAVAVVTIILDAKGKVTTAELINANEKKFGSDAVKAIKTWKINPGRKAGKATACITVVTLRAELTPKAGKYNYRRDAWLAVPKKSEAQK